MEPKRPAFGVQMMVLFVSFIAVLAIMGAGAYYGNYPHDTAPIPAYQTQNLETLKSAQPNDVLTCVVKNAHSHASMAIWAALVEDNSDGKITVGQLNDHRMYFMTPKIPHADLGRTLGYNKCEIQIVPYGTGAAQSKLADILMHGLNPQPQPAN